MPVDADAATIGAAALKAMLTSEITPQEMASVMDAVLRGAEAVPGNTGTVLRSTAALPRPFTVPLPVPTVLRPARSDATMDYYEITAKPGTAEILPGRATEIWGYNGIFPGPTLETRSGRMVVVRHRNELPVLVVAHLHGGKTPPQHDGYPTDLILPGADGTAGTTGGAWSWSAAT